LNKLSISIFPKVEWLDVGPDDGPSQMFPSFFFFPKGKQSQTKCFKALKQNKKKKSLEEIRDSVSGMIQIQSVDLQIILKKKSARQNVEMKI
jgi:hypothetical protein